MSNRNTSIVGNDRLQYSAIPTSHFRHIHAIGEEMEAIRSSTLEQIGACHALLSESSELSDARFLAFIEEPVDGYVIHLNLNPIKSKLFEMNVHLGFDPFTPPELNIKDTSSLSKYGAHWKLWLYLTRLLTRLFGSCLR
jgi:hypothetical protein